MAIFNSDLEAIIFIIIITISLIFIDKVISFFLDKSKKVSIQQKNGIYFIIRTISVIIVIFFVLEGFPSFELIDPTYKAILTGVTSTAIAFASSEIFANFMAGFVLIAIGPFDIGDIVKIDTDKGIVRSISMTKVILETFDNIFIVKSNSEVISSKIVNYTTKLRKIERYVDFKKKVQSPQDKGDIRIKMKTNMDEIVEKNTNLMAFFRSFSRRQNPDLHTYTFRMHFQYEKFRIKLDKVEGLCTKYKKKFGFKPRYNIIGFSSHIIIKFRILSLDPKKILENKPKFTNDLYKIIFSHNM